MANRVAHLSGHLQKKSVVPVNVDSVNGVERDVPFVLNDLLKKPEVKVTPAQAKQYEEEGWFLVKGLISPEEMKGYIDHFQKICKGEVKTDALVMKDVVLAKRMKAEGREALDGEMEVTKVQDFENIDELMEYVHNKKIQEYILPIVGESIRSTHTMLINKPPDLGEGTSVHPVHQDLLYFPFRPCNRVVAAWTALQKIDEENGCLYVVPKSHKLGMFPHFQPKGNAFYQGINQEIVDEIMKDPEYKLVQLPMEAGDTVFFHPCLFHGSGPNLSKRYRKAISCHYTSGISTFPNLPEHCFGLVDDIITTASKAKVHADKFPAGNTVSKLSYDEKNALYRVIWKAKSRSIAGENHEAWELTDEEQHVLAKTFAPSN